MTRRTPQSRLVLLGISVMLVLTACSIQPPSIELIGGGVDGSNNGDAGIAVDPETGRTIDLPVTLDPQAPTADVPAGPAAASCLGQATDTGVGADEIKLGSTIAASGPTSNISGPIVKGMLSYFNQVNAQGGVHGRKIKLVWYDDGWDAQRGKGLIKKLVEQDKVFVLSVVPSSNGLDASKAYLEEKRMPVFGTSGLIESQFRSPMQWPVGTSTKSAARIGLVDMKQRGATNAALIWLDLLAGAEARDAFRDGVVRVLGKNRPEDFITSEQRVNIAEADFGPVWTRIQSDTRRWQSERNLPVDGIPDFVSFFIDPTNAIKALQAAEKLNFRPKKGWGGGAPLFLDLVPQGSAYAGKTGLLAGTSFFPPLPEVAAKNPAVNLYIQTVRKFYGDDVDLNNPYLEGGYAGAALTVEILKRVGPCLTREGAIKAADSITNYSAAGLTQPLTYRPIGVGAGHYGNLHGQTVKATPDGWVIDGTSKKDPTPGVTTE